MAISYLKRLIRLVFGLFLYGLGTFLSIHGNIGLAPWDAFAMGISNATGISMGTAVIATAIVILFLDILMHEKIGIGTILDALLVGTFVDMIEGWGIIPMMQSFVPGVAMLLLGQVIICMGSFLYIGAAFGCGPRDALMVALGKRFNRAPIGLVRALLEGSALLVGFLLGAKVGVGTLIAVLCIGFILEGTFRLLHFDVKAVSHESILDTIRKWQGKGAEATLTTEAPTPAGTSSPQDSSGE